MTRPLMKRQTVELLDAADVIERITALFVRGDGLNPSMVETAWMLYNDDATDDEGRLRVTAADKVRIFKAFAEMVGVREIALAQRGLKAAPGKVVNHTHFTQINLSVEEFEKLPEDLKRRFMSEQMAVITNRRIAAPDEA